jgi:hypothetical protein
MLTAGGARGAPFLARQPCFRSGVFGQSAGSRLIRAALRLEPRPDFRQLSNFQFQTWDVFETSAGA